MSKLQPWQLEVLRNKAKKIQVVGGQNAGKTQSLVNLAYNQGMWDGAVAIAQLDRIQGVARKEPINVKQSRCQRKLAL